MLSILPDLSLILHVHVHDECFVHAVLNVGISAASLFVQIFIPFELLRESTICTYLVSWHFKPVALCFGGIQCVSRLAF